VAPSACEGLRIYSNAFTFTFQYVTRANEVDPASGVKAGAATGAAVSAEQFSATDFRIDIPAPRGNPFGAGELVGIIVGHSSDSLFIYPIRPGGQ
jgi:hypothetical protein